MVGKRRTVTGRQLLDGFWIMWSDGRERRCFYTDVKRVGLDVFDVAEPEVSEGGSMVFNASRELELPDGG